MFKSFDKYENSSSPLYIKLYEYYKELIIKGDLAGSSKMPSVRRCAQELEISRTTVESAYMQLAAEGYIISKPQSGFYVADIDLNEISMDTKKDDIVKERKNKIEFDFVSTAVDKESFDFALWRRYIKSAFRSDERLLNYGEPQGEYDLRCAISDYVRKSRSVMCSPEQIIIGASVQSLLYFFCAFMKGTGNVAFTGPAFEKGEVIFKDMDFNTMKIENPTNFEQMQKNKIKIIYASPSHINIFGDILPVKDRVALLKYAENNNCIIIEDDYDSEFRYYSRPVPSLQGMGSDRVVYMGTFSKLLLPSIRVSFMILPKELIKKYEQKKSLYNQTASKAEQIALCQFIRDGHLESQIRKARKLYMNKSKALCEEVERVFGNKASAKPLQSGLFVLISIKSDYSAEKIEKEALKNGVKLKSITVNENADNRCFLLSCSNVPVESFNEALKRIKQMV
ncbi:MAG: PLP-dependent aminotransferase family protein [Clostridiales bacterium]|nr:PLP-dependent aminotransferase family protein [Clostridiales bacterium]